MQYDLAVIGAGWAGFNAAKRARELGLKVALIEKREIGGTCLNRGCIPTKTLIQSAKVYTLSKKAKNFGIEVLQPQISFREIQARKDQLVQNLRQGLEFLLKGVDVIRGQAQILSSNALRVDAQKIEARFMLVACGSRPQELKEIKFDGSRVISSDDILNLKAIPKSLLIIGGGVIGCEFAQLFSTLGAQVSLIEKLPYLLPSEDKEIAKRLETIFKKRGIKVSTNSDALSLDLKNYDSVLICIGRIPDTQGLGLEELGVNLERGKIVTDEYLKTNIPNIFAAGDCAAKTMLAHFAAYQGRLAAENIAKPDSQKRADNANIPNCIFTDPEIASVSLKEEEAIAKGLAIKIHRFDFLGSGMARILDETEGFIKIISEKNTDRVLGASIIGPRATELIALLTLAISTGLTTAQIRNTIFAHPTLSESIHDCLKEEYGA